VPQLTSLVSPSFELVHHVLGNGLRVVLAPDTSAPVVGVAVLYDVGMRSEPEGRTGFAHLFEHLMFQGSANLDKLEHFRYVQSSGGTFNGSTHVDYTNYFEALPSNALERGLFLEADRMRSPRITEENLANQLDVVKNEIRVNVLNRPYGGFPWIYLPPVLFDTFANSHNGYGGFEDLESATVDDAADFFAKYYTPANAVLALGGDFEADAALEMIERHFAGIASQPAPERPSFAEPPLAAERRETHHDAQAPIPAVAIGYRIPDPVRSLREHLAHILLAEVLSDGDASRLQVRLVQRDHLVTDISVYLGEFGDPFDERDPSVFTISAHYPNAGSLPAILTGIDEELARIVENGLEPGELDRVRTRLVSVLFRELDAVISRTLEFAKFELIYGRAEMVAELPELLAAVTVAELQRAAAALTPDRRAVLELVAGGTR
jgi:predicted Zn-dependent peptidase